MPESPGQGPDAARDDLPEQMRVRRQKRERLIERGLEAYPLTVERTHNLAEIVSAYGADELGPDARTGVTVSVTGRVIFLRNTGRLCFARLREGDGTELQAMFSEADIGEESLADLKALVDIGDHLAVHGEVVTSRRGELSIKATSWRMAAKALRPLANEHTPLS
jgi:lysyl-tRNA synthetase class 2